MSRIKFEKIVPFAPKTLKWVAHHQIISLLAIVYFYLAYKNYIIQSLSGNLLSLQTFIFECIFFTPIVIVALPLTKATLIGLKSVYLSYATNNFKTFLSVLWLILALFVLMLSYLFAEGESLEAKFPIIPLNKSIYEAGDYALAQGAWVYETEPLEERYLQKLMGPIEHSLKSIRIKCTRLDMICSALDLETINRTQYLEESSFTIETWQGGIIVFSNTTRCQEERYTLDITLETLNGKSIYNTDFTACPENEELFSEIPFLPQGVEVSWTGHLEDGLDVRLDYMHDNRSLLSRLLFR